MTLQQLLYAVTIADEKSINKAAASLYVSQPALSSMIHSLEEEMQISIFVRTNKGILITPEGEQFLSYARQMIEMQQMMEERFVEKKHGKKRFSVSMQHYSFAVEAFIKLARQFDINDYAFAVHETKTYEVIENVKNGKSEIGILYLNDFNGKAMNKIFQEYRLEFVPLFSCGISVYLSEQHPLAKKEVIQFDELVSYPCLSFEQGENNSFYYAEEVLSTYQYHQIIKANDRATMLNLMVGLNGYTLCSGIICEELNGGGYVAVPLATDDTMQIGYIKRSNMPLSELADEYITILRGYHTQEDERENA